MKSDQRTGFKKLPRLEGMHRFQNPLHANNNVKFKNK